MPPLPAAASDFSPDIALKSLVNDEALMVGVDDELPVLAAPVEPDEPVEPVDAAGVDVELLLLDDPHAAIAKAAMMVSTIAAKPALLVRKCTVSTS
jgi:hypothetical protein